MEKKSLNKNDGFTIFGAVKFSVIVYILVIIITIIAMLFMFGIISIYNELFTKNFNFNNKILFGIIGIISEIIVLIIIYEKGYMKNISIKINKKISKEKLILLFYLVLGVLCYILIFNNTVDVLIERFLKQSILNLQNMVNEEGIVTFIFTSVTIGPIFEEVVNRGIILKKLTLKYKNSTSIIVSALIFAISHFNIAQGINAFFLGIIFAIVYLKTNSLKTVIFMHCINNLIVILIGACYADKVGIVSKINYMQLLIGMLIFISLIIIYKKNKLLKKEEIEIL
ncbi:CPBP family intramembrane glutamic endopeptidase [Haliovirga abyssi]|uniref:CAAX prenyl protease 2/Lysostaphin resistance protein A-like domain-containing protein n=1 Tax=Haliovirga abyssi TaxID=2996794 RepID=A0AAU9D5K1_9FUSO|nr:CPBP family intramembrane glutamic endopeptidase [Haliovirga abyssi]BDU51259.1 hypothetical protein HLVA_18280 [Haliovirga abyssi]